MIARDFDDALCIEDGPDGGTRVWVAVAVVLHYVRWDDPLDRESTLRGGSVYLPGRVIPMLPHQRSSIICSLLPDVDRCAMVVRLDYDRDANLIAESHAAAVIRSQARLDYPGVAAALRGDFRGRREAYRPWLGELERLNALAQRLRAQRRARGTLDLDLPEAKVILDADDPRLVRDVVRAKGDPDVKGAYQLVEEFIIAANESVGRVFRKRGAPTVWRVHAPPSRARVEELAAILGGLGMEGATGNWEETRPEAAQSCIKAQKAINALSARHQDIAWLGVINRLPELIVIKGSGSTAADTPTPGSWLPATGTEHGIHLFDL